MSKWKAGQKLKCVDSGFTLLEDGKVYTVRMPLGYNCVELVEFPCRDFADDRFKLHKEKKKEVDMPTVKDWAMEELNKFTEKDPEDLAFGVDAHKPTPDILVLTFVRLPNARVGDPELRSEESEITPSGDIVGT